MTERQPMRPRLRWRALLALLLCLTTIGAMPAPALGGTLRARWASLRDAQIPLLLRALGVVPESPEAVARAALRALDRRDTQQLRRMAGAHPGAAALAEAALAAWPAGLLDQPGAWVMVGPYASEPWYIRAPDGAVRRIPVRLYHPSGCALCIIWLRASGAEWHLMAITGIAQEPRP
jgi:hypothetical protein